MLTHRVQKGDTLGRIAQQYYGDPGRYPLIVAANRITDPDRLTVGQELVIPDAATAARGVVPATAAAPAPSTVSNNISALNDQRLAQVHPIVAARGRSMIDICAHQGLTILVTQGLRTWAEQDALYAKGRTTKPIGPQYIVTKAKGGQSWHNFGLAFDIAVLDAMGKADWDTSHPGWSIAARVGKSVGLEWGGDWKGFKDLPHFQYTGSLTLAQCCQLFPAGIQAVWQRVA
jgi:D-alanyl-D-alanine carboxypeptidase-like protein/LysM domain-containing protein